MNYLVNHQFPISSEVVNQTCGLTGLSKVNSSIVVPWLARRPLVSDRCQPWSLTACDKDFHIFNPLLTILLSLLTIHHDLIPLSIHLSNPDPNRDLPQPVLSIFLPVGCVVEHGEV